MDMTGERRIPAPRRVVWDALNDPEVLKASIPGCQNLDKLSDTEMKATAAIKIGPISARFTGNVLLSDLDPPNGYTIGGEGQGGVAGFAKGGAKVQLEDDGADTLLRYEVHAQVGGKIAQLGARLIDASAKQMADQFFDRFSARVAPPEVVAESAEPIAAASGATAQATAASAAPAGAAASAAIATPAGAAASPAASAEPVFPAAPRPASQPVASGERAFPSAPSEEVANKVLPPANPRPAIGLTDMVPHEPGGFPMAVWIGGAVFLAIVLLFLVSIL